MNHRNYAPLLLLVFGVPAAAQQSQPAPPQLADRIYAVVGDSVILERELKEELDRAIEGMRARSETPPADSAAIARLREEILGQLIDQLVLVQAALRDSTLTVEEDVLNAQVEKDISDRRTRMGGAEQFDAALAQQRYTLNEFRELLLAGLRKQALSERFLQKIAAGRKPPPISEKELKEEFERARATFPPRPPTITFQQIVLVPTASDSARARARAKADSVLAEIRAGADFATTAKRDSDDPGSRENGGDLGWARPSSYVKEFADAVQFLRAGEVSPVVETSYGFHIIKLEKVRAGERQARHILIAPTASENDVERALERGRETAEKIRAGADVDSLHRAIGDVSITQTKIGPVDRSRLAEIGPAYQEHLGGVTAPGVVGPFVVGGEGGTPRRIVVVKVTEVHEGGQYTIDDPALNFRRRIEQKRLVGEIIDDLRRQTYIDIRQ